MELPIFQVDAFTSRIFAGNPAAVCPLEQWIGDEAMQAIAAENNLSETAFFVPEGDVYRLRWFTPQSEVDLCGHATLASGFVFLNILSPEKSSIQFQTRSGILTVTRDAGLLAMDFPAFQASNCDKIPRQLQQGLSPETPVQILQAKHNYLVVYEHEDQVRSVRPDFQALAELHPFGVCITAPGQASDFVSRFFVPSYGIPEDPVTGSTHSVLTPYWSARLNKRKLHARQLSRRGGEMWCEFNQEGVTLKGAAALYLKGAISV